jgi:hypothetical protein
MKVRTVKGLELDMAALATRHDQVRAVGNVPMNARGDRLNSAGDIVIPVQAITQKQFDLTEPHTTVGLSQVEKTTTPAANKNDSLVVNQTKHTREDGSVFNEVEYDDGSIEIVEISKPASKPAPVKKQGVKPDSVTAKQPKKDSNA